MKVCYQALKSFRTLFLALGFVTMLCSGSAFAAKASSKDSVVLYGTAWCHYCKQARAYFKEHNIEFTDNDIEHSMVAMKRYEDLKGSGVPLIFIGSERIDGFNKSAVEAALKKQGLLK